MSGLGLELLCQEPLSDFVDGALLFVWEATRQFTFAERERQNALSSGACDHLSGPKSKGKYSIQSKSQASVCTIY